MDNTIPPSDDDLITNLDAGRWHISPKWSMEAIVQAAHEMTFWYMEKVGERVRPRMAARYVKGELQSQEYG